MDELRKQKVKQYIKLYNLSKETNQKDIMIHSLKAIMAFKGDLTKEMKEDIEKLPIGVRDVRSDDYTVKWLYGDIKPFNSFYIKGQEMFITEITSLKEIQNIQNKIYEMDNRIGRNKNSLGDNYIDKASNGEFATFKVTSNRLKEKEFGYVIVMGIPNKRGYITITIIDTEHCNMCDIGAEEMAKAVSNSITYTLEMLNTGYSVKAKIVY